MIIVKLIAFLMLMLFLLLICRSKRSEFESCYDDEEFLGRAVFGCCSGKDELCKKCPHFVDVVEQIDGSELE